MRSFEYIVERFAKIFLSQRSEENIIHQVIHAFKYLNKYKTFSLLPKIAEISKDFEQRSNPN